MKLLNFGTRGDAPRLGVAVGGQIIDPSDMELRGRAHSISGPLPTTVDEYLRASSEARSQVQALARLGEDLLASDNVPGVYREEDVTFYQPVLRPGKVIAAGRNFTKHLAEAKDLWEKRGFADVKTPEVPIGFIKVQSALTGHNQPIRVPEWIAEVDYEVELAVVIGKVADGVRMEDALSYVAGYTVANDVSARKIQFAERESGGGACAGKNPRTFGPMGPCLVTADEIADPESVRLWSKVNGVIRQDALTSDMIFGVRALIAWYSQVGLDVGDIIMSGTPAGVGAGGKDFLKSGDVVECGVDGIGVLRNVIVGA